MSHEPIDPIVAKAWEAYQAEDYQTAAQLFSQASDNRALDGDALGTAELRNNLSVALLKAGNAKAALDAALGSDAVFAEAGDTKRQAMALANIATALEELNRLGEALEHFKQSSALFQQVGEDDMRSYVLKRISTIQMRMGNQIEALASMDASIESKARLTLVDRILRSLMKVIRRMTGSS